MSEQDQSQAQPARQRHFRLKDIKREPPPTMEFDVQITDAQGSRTETQTYEMLDLNEMSMLDEADIDTMDAEVDDAGGFKNMLPLFRDKVRIIFKRQLPEPVLEALTFDELMYIFTSFRQALDLSTAALTEATQQSQSRGQKRRRRRSRSRK